ncbi:MAG TPA: flavin reductase family protein [Longimicrobiales bacterium]|nr:flavin reductase family protein [Longimicrobiales bacterium]
MSEGLSFRQVMGVFPTGVTVVVARGSDGAPRGLTVNSFASVSLDPPLVLVCIDRASSTHDCLVRATTFTVSILGAHQEEMATRFAFEASETRFRDEEWEEEAGGALVPEGAAAWVSCDLEAVHEGGDHSILVGRVRSMGAGEADALVFYRGRYGTVSP